MKVILQVPIYLEKRQIKTVQEVGILKTRSHVFNLVSAILTRECSEAIKLT